MVSPDIWLFWWAFWCYLAAFVLFAVYLGAGKDRIGWIGAALTGLGFLPQTVGFFVRWVLSRHYPLSNMYEYLAIMSWMAALTMGIVLWRYRRLKIAALISPIIFMLMVTASLLPKEINMQLMPALQSYWLTIHVTLAAIGSGALAVGAIISFLYLVHDPDLVGKEKPLTGARGRVALVSGVGTPLAVFIILALLGALPTSAAAFTFGNTSINGAGSIFAAFGIGAPLGAVIWEFWHRRVTRKNAESAGGGYLFAVAFLSFLLGALLTGILTKMAFFKVTAGSPFRIFEFFGLSWILTVPLFFLLNRFFRNGGRLAKFKLDRKLLDEVSAGTIKLGYPLYTVGALFAGAIWAEQAWGSFWSWDPKEVGALIIWLFYSGFLHARLQRGWTGTRSATLSLAGFGMILLSFFGNYFFGGLHAYA
jgi:ABC-type transport system involved in cytochrome c biogenesis permease subunit